MAITISPILNTIPAFDGEKETKITFTCRGIESQVAKNRLVIKNNETNNVLYDITKTDARYEHTIPSKALQNNAFYRAYITVLDRDGNESPKSNEVLFKCIKTPIFVFTNISETMQNSAFEAKLKYSQPDGEMLNTYQVILYSFSKNQLFHSGLKYFLVPPEPDGDGSITIEDFGVPISNLDNHMEYYIRAAGETLNGLSVDTGYIHFSVSYDTPSVFTAIELTNAEKQGSIQITSNIIALEGKASGDAPFLDNSKIDLSKNDASVVFEKGFLLENDFTLQVLFQGPEAPSDILILENEKHRIIVSWHKGAYTSTNSEEKAYVKTVAEGTLCNYVQQSNYIDIPSPTDRLQLWLRKKNHIYEVKIDNISQEVNGQ